MEKKYYAIYNSQGFITHCIDTNNWIILDILNSLIVKLDNQNAQDVLSILLTHPREISILELCDKLGYSDRTIRRAIEKLCEYLGNEVLPPTKGKQKKIQDHCNPIEMKKYGFYYEKIINHESNQYNSLNELINREEYINQIELILEKNHICGLVGGPGVGKTSLALKYIQNHQYQYKQYQFNCANLNSLAQSLGIQTSLDHIFNIEERIYSSLSNLILTHKNEKLIFVFDNISFDDNHTIKNIESKIQNIIHKINKNYSKYVDILYTARFEKRNNYEIIIEDFTENEAYEFLIKNIGFEYKVETIQNIIHKNKLPIYLNTIKTLAIE